MTISIQNFINVLIEVRFGNCDFNFLCAFQQAAVIAHAHAAAANHHKQIEELNRAAMIHRFQAANAAAANAAAAAASRPGMPIGMVSLRINVEYH